MGQAENRAAVEDRAAVVEEMARAIENDDPAWNWRYDFMISEDDTASEQPCDDEENFAFIPTAFDEDFAFDSVEF